MITILGWAFVAVIVWQLILHLFYNEEDVRTPGEFISDVKHNRKIDKQWRKDGKPILWTTVGWRPDPSHGEDGYRNNHDGSFSRLIRGGTPEYREKFAKDVEESRKDTIWK